MLLHDSAICMSAGGFRLRRGAGRPPHSDWPGGTDPNRWSKIRFAPSGAGANKVGRLDALGAYQRRIGKLAKGLGAEGFLLPKSNHDGFTHRLEGILAQESRQSCHIAHSANYTRHCYGTPLFSSMAHETKDFRSC